LNSHIRRRQEVGDSSPTSPTRRAAVVAYEGEWTHERVKQRLRECAVLFQGDLQATEADDPAREAIAWLGHLADEDARLIRMYVCGTPWKSICFRLGVARATANRQLQYLLTVIAWRLNGRIIPMQWSRRRLLERTKELPQESKGHTFDCVRHLRIGQTPFADRSLEREVDRVNHAHIEAAHRCGQPGDSKATAQDGEQLLPVA
jgi:hypothetical protein